ncbi:hypothetical protein OC834_006758, partial [Tilletia horrida]
MAAYIISGSVLTRALEMATLATRSPPSATVLKDITQEALHDEQDTLWVEPEVLCSAVDAVVQQHNHKALRQLLFRALSFIPAQHPAAFTDAPTKGFFYVRELRTDAQ